MQSIDQDSDYKNHEHEAFVLLYNSKGGETRRKVLQLLLEEPKNCYQLSKALEVTWWGVKKHLELLLEYGLVEKINVGKREFYKLTKLGIFLIGKSTC